MDDAKFNVLNWGLIGAGDIARKRIAPAMRDLDNCSLAAVSRGQAVRAAEFAAEFGVDRSYGDWHDLLADDGIDAVYVATPVFLHAEQTISAAKAGKHVLCEKPMAMNAEECDLMIEACAANDVRLGIAYYRRFYPVLDRIRRAIAGGEIGKPVYAQMNAFEYFDVASDNSRHWIIEKEKSGGGPMMDFGCHRLEVLTDLFGPAERCTSLLSNAIFNREVEDTASVLLHFDSGLSATVIISHAAAEKQDTLDIFGTGGSIHVPELNLGEMTLTSSLGSRTESHPPNVNLHLPLINDFADAVLNGREPRVGGATGRYIAELEDMIYERG